MEISTESKKALKAAGDIIIVDGKYTIDSYDDSIHSHHSVQIQDGQFCIRSGDDGIHADHTLQILGGKIDIEKSFEGLEGWQIAVNGGEISIIASDDGVNATTNVSTIGELKGFFAKQALGKMEITDGSLMINSEGDSLDSNGIMTISGGIIRISGPQSGGGGDGIVDCDGSKTLSGGILLCTGMSTRNNVDGSGEYFDTTNQDQIIREVELQSEGTVLQLQDSSGVIIVTFEAPKSFNYIVAIEQDLTMEGELVLLLNGERVP